MFAKCPNHNIIRIKGNRKTCPYCSSRLNKATMEELQFLGENAIDRARAVRCLVDTTRGDKALNLAAFMAIFHGKHLAQSEAKEMLGIE